MMRIAFAVIVFGLTVRAIGGEITAGSDFKLTAPFGGSVPSLNGEKDYAQFIRLVKLKKLSAIEEASDSIALLESGTDVRVERVEPGIQEGDPKTADKPVVVSLLKDGVPESQRHIVPAAYVGSGVADAFPVFTMTYDLRSLPQPGEDIVLANRLPRPGYADAERNKIPCAPRGSNFQVIPRAIEMKDEITLRELEQSNDLVWLPIGTRVRLTKDLGKSDPRHFRDRDDRKNLSRRRFAVSFNAIEVRVVEGEHDREVFQVEDFYLNRRIVKATPYQKAKADFAKRTASEGDSSRAR